MVCARTQGATGDRLQRMYENLVNPTLKKLKEDAMEASAKDTAKYKEVLSKTTLPLPHTSIKSGVRFTSDRDPCSLSLPSNKNTLGKRRTRKKAPC